jgi:hypothetical protein
VRSLAGVAILFDMSVSTFKIGKKEYVVLSRKRYEQLTRGKRYEQYSRSERDEIDSEIAKAGMKAYRSGKMKTLSLEEFKRKLGI